MSPWAVRAGERGLTVALSGYFFLLMAALYLMKPARNALFLEDLGADNLPWVYIATAFVTWWVVAAYVRGTRVAHLQLIIRATLAITLVSLLAFWLWLTRPSEGATMVFYVWVKVYAVLLPSQFWLLAEEMLDPRQARRLFGPIGAGGVLGGIAGGLVAVAVASLLSAEILLLFAAGATLAAWGLFESALADSPPTRAGTPRPRRGGAVSPGVNPPSTGEIADPTAADPGARAPHGRTLVLTISAILLAATTAHTIVDWQFNKAAESIVDADGRAAFFASFFTVLNVVTLGVQMFATSFVLRYFGVGVAMALLPAAIALGALGILLYPLLWMVSLARGADDALRLSVDQSGRELLFLPFSSTERQHLKPRIDLIASRVANGLAGVIILLAIWWLDDPLRWLSVVTLLIAAAWAVLVLQARRQYTHTLQHLLTVRDLDIGGVARARLDAGASSAIRDGLASADEETVDAALALAEHTDPRAFVPEMRALLRSTDNDELRNRVLGVLARTDDERSVDETLASLDAEDTAAAAEALAYACATKDLEARERIFDYLDSSEMMLETNAIRPTLQALLGDESPHVVRGALAACARFPDGGLVPAICAAGSDNAVEGSALQALQAFGGRAIGTLTGILADPRNQRPLRCFAARALGRVGGSESAAGLIAGLVADDRKVRRASLKALNYMRRRGEELDIGREREAAAIAIEWRDFLSLQRFAAALGAPGTHSPAAFVATVIDERLWESQEQLFRALALRHPIQAIFFAYRGLITGDAAARSHAIELVDSIVETPQRRTLVRLLETAERLQRGRIAARELGTTVPTVDEALRELLDPGDPWMAACALRALGGDPETIPLGLRQELRAHDYPPINELLAGADPAVPAAG